VTQLPGHHDGHDHDHDHPHAPLSDETPAPGYFQALEAAVRELLIEKGVITPEALRRQIERMDAITPALGAKLVARAWVDPDFKARALADGTAAARELGLETGAMRLIVVESTPTLHNLVVCTLCSCYPRPLLGIPPDWYKSRAYRSRAVREPRAVLAEFGTVVPDHVEVRVHDSTADMRYLVLPERPPGTEGWDEERLATLVTRDTMIGVARVAMT
jgi:nitrile hydratase alpha subunit